MGEGVVPLSPKVPNMPDDELERRILSLLDRRDRFEGEIRHELRHEPPVRVDAALARLRAFLDDRRVLEAYLHGHGGRRALGRDRMREELACRLAPPELAEEALSGLPSESERAAELLRAERKVRTRAQAGRFLLSRGFDEDAVDGALDGFFDEG